ncbi:YPDG domain-containing protein [Corynebacterium sp. UMB2355A]|uniref:YPDG domain-containing protein n=1 Tax=Corynebacterium sp. UMB2355A TaxID=3081222 RepID=UPI0029FF0C01|nr:YPDG domain-containing protein [Corynebacterium sp. UMB2355A]WPJ93620.1 YPDG domain-containing protein [Corynebacterium sp. UMB2355A]
MKGIVVRSSYKIRRGTSIAAAALSFALVAPLAQPVAFAQEETSATADQGLIALEPAESVGAYEDAIYSPGEADKKGTISGSVKEVQEILAGFGEVQDAGKALQGVKVFAQWYEGVNTEHASPVYYTMSDENGNFTLNMAPYTDAEGVERTFMADASVGLTTGKPSGRRDQRREKIRMWAELPEELVHQYRLVHQPAAGIFPTTTTTPGTQGDGQWVGNRVKGVTIQYAQKTDLPQHLPQEQWAESQGGGSAGAYWGRAFWNLRVLQGALRHDTLSKYDGSDVPAAGLTVVGSYLSDEAVKAIHEYVKENFAGKTLRGKGWTVDDEQGLQKWINDQVAADPEGWIAETVKTTTAADGKFSLYWRGLWGNSWESTPGTFTPPADKLHTLADSHDQGSWAEGNRSSKHVNTDWSYVQLLDKDGNTLPDNIGMLYPWSLGHWDGPNTGTSMKVFGGGGSLISRSTGAYGNWNIALYPAPLKFDVLEKNTYDNWARVGETVETLTDGLPVGEGLEYTIEWTNDAGEVVKTCDPIAPDASTRIPSCSLTVPADVEHGDVFTARLYQGKDSSGTLLAQDAFAVTTSYLAYEPADAKVGVAKESTPTFDDPKTEAEEPKLESAKFFLNEEKLPEGVTADQVTVDETTGVVTFTPKAGQEGKSFDIPVKMVDTAIQVPVYDENGDPVVDEGGNQVTRPRTIFHAPATFKVAEKPVADTVEPKYANELVVPGKETKSTPSFTDKDGKGVDVPEGAKFTIPEDFQAPAGYKVDIDETTGEITVTVDGVNKDTVEKFEVPVTVTYKDGSTDEVTAPFYLDTDGDGKPDFDGGYTDKDGNDVEGDTDDDNDGVSDEDEKDKGSDPKDKNSIPATVDTEKKVVVEGQPTDPFDTAKDVPEGGKVTVDGLPDGLTVDDKNGKVTGTPEKITDWGKDEEERDVTVTVTITDKDGKEIAKDKKVITVQRDTDGDGTPDVNDNDDDGDGFTDEQEKEAGTDPKDPNSKPEDKTPAPSIETGEKTDEVPADNKPKTLDDKVKNPTEGMTGDVLDKDGNPIENAKVEVDPKTGEIKVTVPEGTEPQDGKVVVKDKDGNKVGEIDIKITEPKDETPAPSIETGEKTDEVPADNKPKPLDDKVKNPTDGMTGDVLDKDGNPIKDAKVEVDPNTGEIKVTVPEGTEPQDGKVVVKDKDGNPVGEIDIKITKPAPSIEPGGKTDDVPADNKPKTLDDKVKNPTEGMTGDVLDKDRNPIKDAKVEVDPNTGEIKVTVPEGTEPQDGKVVVKDKDGNKVGEIDINILDPKSDAVKNTPDYGAPKNVEAGKTETSDPFEDKTNVPVKEAKGTPSAGSDDWDFNTVPETGVVDATAPGYDKVGEKIKSELPNIDSSWEKFKKIFTPYVEPSVTVDFVYNDGSNNSGVADFVLVGKDGKSLLDPEGDFDGDGISNKDEIEGDSNPANGDEIPDTTAPEINPVAPGDKTISGKGDRPGEDIKVTLPNGKVIETTTDKDGNWKISVPSNVELKPGDKITVEDGKGNSAEVTVKDTTKPTINDIKPGDKTISGKGDRPGEDIKVTLPNGKVIKTTTDKDGNWKISVPSNVELKPGDKVTVEDGSGNTATAQVGIDTGKCVASAVGFGLPLIALLPLGLASQIQIPVLSDVAAQVDAQLQAVNTRIQQQAGIFNPEMARQAEQINAQLRTVGADLGMVAAGIVLIAAGILAGTVIYDNCNPNGPKSSVKDLELKGSSGKTTKLSSKTDNKTPAKQEKKQQ